MIVIRKVLLWEGSLITTFCFVSDFLSRIYGVVGRGAISLGPDKLNEIPWMEDTLRAIGIGLVCGAICYKLAKIDKAQGKEIHMPRMKFPNFFSAILFFSVLFFGFLFIFAIREYNDQMSGVSYLFRRTLWQYCSTNVPLLEMLATSVIFGTILAIGFSTTPSQEKKEETKAKEE